MSNLNNNNNIRTNNNNNINAKKQLPLKIPQYGNFYAPPTISSSSPPARGGAVPGGTVYQKASRQVFFTTSVKSENVILERNRHQPHRRLPLLLYKMELQYLQKQMRIEMKLSQKRKYLLQLLRIQKLLIDSEEKLKNNDNAKKKLNNTVIQKLWRLM